MGVSEAVFAELLDAYNERKKPEALAVTLDKVLDELARDPTYPVLPDTALWIVLRAVQREAEINIAASEGLVGPALQIGGVGGAAGLAIVTVAGALALPLLSVGLIIAG